MIITRKLHLISLISLISIYANETSAKLTKEEFDLTVTSNGYLAPEDEVHRYFEETTNNFTRKEIAMFIAQLIHESGGFKYTEQLACLEGDHCQGMYVDSVGWTNKTYHGRGYIQLTWGANYKLASEGLGMGDLLLKNPELVATDKKIAMRVSVWYWESRVRPLLKSREDSFGITTLGINPDECVGVNPLAKRRYRIYLKVAEVLKISDRAKESGCYD